MTKWAGGEGCKLNDGKKDWTKQWQLTQEVNLKMCQRNKSGWTKKAKSGNIKKITSSNPNEIKIH